MRSGGSSTTSGNDSGFCVTKTRSLTSLVVQQFLAEKNIPVNIQPPYTPDHTQGDFWLFPPLKIGLMGTRFATMNIKSNATAVLRKMPKEVFRLCFQQWQDRLRKCVCVRERACVHVCVRARKGPTSKMIR
jgi:hypothetical protein